ALTSARPTSSPAQPASSIQPSPSDEPSRTPSLASPQPPSQDSCWHTSPAAWLPYSRSELCTRTSVPTKQPVSFFLAIAPTTRGVALHLSRTESVDQHNIVAKRRLRTPPPRRAERGASVASVAPARAGSCW